MTREAVRSGYEEFVDDVIAIAYDEFDVIGALRRGTTGSGSRVVSKLAKRSELLDRKVVRPELQEYRDALLDQFEYFLEYAASDEPFEAFEEEIIAADVYYDTLRDDLPRQRRAEIREELLDLHRGLADEMRPLVESEHSEFWAAVQDAFDREETHHFIDEEFGFTGPIVEYREAYRFVTRLDPAELLSSRFAAALPSIEIEYTDEAVRTLIEAERRVIEETHEEIDEYYDTGGQQA